MLSVWRPHTLSRSQQEERRLYAQRLLEAGEASTKEIATALGVSESTVRGWKKELRDHGPDALKATKAAGPRPALSPEQREELRSKLREGPKAHGWPDHRWTTLRVRELIGHSFGVWQHRDHVRKVLHDLGFSCQKPDARSVERDEERVRTWVENIPPELEKKGRRRGDVAVR